ncbi:MAG: pilus assembly protein PilM [Chitinispirillales bacterium]|jgi:Tfp pilus assembly PilM family ATPase|nr:pilus assembly protein PilM [Chitinispirillales bacterium]
MAKKRRQIFVGFDQDSASIRAVRLALDPPRSWGRAPDWEFLGAEEETGNFTDEAQLVASLKGLRDRLKIQPTDFVITCLSGKQTYAVQVDVRRLPDDEMPNMLRLELRKSMPFEATVATFDYQFLSTESGSGREGGGGVPVMVSAAANSYLSKHIDTYAKANLRPSHVEILPISIANAFWAMRSADPKAVAAQETYAILHLSSNTCTIVIDGGKHPFFNRSFNFNIGEIVASAGAAAGAEPTSPGRVSNVTMQMNSLATEVTKSITYYKNTFKGSQISGVALIGNHASHSAFEAFGTRVGHELQRIHTGQLVRAPKSLGVDKYDLAIALAMQGMGQGATAGAAASAKKFKNDNIGLSAVPVNERRGSDDRRLQVQQNEARRMLNEEKMMFEEEKKQQEEEKRILAEEKRALAEEKRMLMEEKKKQAEAIADEKRLQALEKKMQAEEMRRLLAESGD